MNPSCPIRRTVTVANPHGLHMRPATAFASRAKQFACRVTVWNGSNKADGKSSLDLILLVALPGAELTLEVDGPDADHAAEALADLLGSPGDGL
jgi:phosphocarrier protein HPr